MVFRGLSSDGKLAITGQFSIRCREAAEKKAKAAGLASFLLETFWFRGKGNTFKRESGAFDGLHEEAQQRRKKLALASWRAPRSCDSGVGGEQGPDFDWGWGTGGVLRQN